MNILVLDSDPPLLRKIKTVLEDFGCRVESESNGTHALLLLQKNRYDMMIVGFDLHGITGDELIKTVKQKVPPVEIPPAIVGIGCDWECGRLLESGASLCLEKPFGVELLIDTISTLAAPLLYKSTADGTLSVPPKNKGVSTMSNGFQAVSTEHVRENPFTLIGEEWMLITAGTIDSWNTMTAAWGGLGYLWNREVSYCFVRPNRHTYRFMEKADYYTLSFFDAAYKDALNFCGTHSGRDVDKAKETGLTPVSCAHQTVSFEEARLVFVCRKVYVDDIKPSCFIDESLDRLYPAKQYHRVYIGEIDQCLKKA